MSGREGRGSPLVIAAYKQGDPSRKRRVKVPPNIKWAEFLDLFYDRFVVSRDFAIEIYDEKGIEIVSTDDLLHDDVLVVKEIAKSRPASQDEHEATPNADETSRTTGSDLPSAPPLNLEHFIQASSLGYYFLGRGSSPLRTHGKLRQAHCIVKVPHPSFQLPLRTEAALLSAIAGHKGIIAAPSVCTFDTRDECVQQLCRRLSEDKRRLLQDLLSSPDHASTAYVYPLYGVTMTTKIKADLVPGVVLRYSYQLADIMYFLQEKGVVHLNLLPENIQVMSNDRIVLCNFETAIRTDPSKRLFGSVANIMIPKNKKSLSPETISALTNLTSDTGTVDFSYQYAWNFGVLAVLFSTGQHPLKNYPEQYDSQGVIKYKSIHYQTLPDPNKYPPLFIKVVRRALSCDPIRRPTIVQMLSLIKRDTKILTLMAEHRENQGSSSTSAPGLQPASGGEQSTSSPPEPPNREPSPSSPPEPPNREPSPEHNYENYATKWYCDDHDSLAQSSLSPFHDHTPNELNCFPVVPPSSLTSVPQCQPSNSSQCGFSMMSQNLLPDASLSCTTQNDYFKSQSSLSFFTPTVDDAWLPATLHNQRGKRAGSLSTLTPATQDQAAKDTAANLLRDEQPPQEPSQKKVADGEDPSRGIHRPDTSSVNSSPQISQTATGNTAQLHRSSSLDAAKSDIDLKALAGGHLTVQGAWQGEVDIDDNGPPHKAEVRRGSHGGTRSLFNWAVEGGSGPLYASRRRDSVSVTCMHIAASTPDITRVTDVSPPASINGRSKHLFYRRRRSFSGFVPASSHAVGTSKASSSPVPPPHAAALLIIPPTEQDAAPALNEGASSDCTPGLGIKKATGQACMSPIPEASQEVLTSSQLVDQLPAITSEEHTSPFRHVGLAEGLLSRNTHTFTATGLLGASVGVASTRGGASMKGSLMGGASVGGASVGGASLREVSMGGASTEGPLMSGASTGRPSMGGASTEGPSMGGTSTERPSMGGTSTGRPSMGGASTGEPGKTSTEQGTHTYTSVKRPTLGTKQKQLGGANSKGQTQRQQHMSMDLEVLNRAYSNMDLAERRASGMTPVPPVVRGDPPTTSHHAVAIGTGTSTPPAAARVRRGDQLPMERVRHGRQGQSEGNHHTSSPDVSVGSVPHVGRHDQGQSFNSVTQSTRVSLSQQTNSTAINQPHSHSPVPRSHSPVLHSSTPASHSHSPAEHVTSTQTVTSSVTYTSAPATTASQSALAPGQNDAPSFREPPPSYDEIFGSRPTPSQGQNRSHTLPAGQAPPTADRQRFASLVNFFRRMRRGEATEVSTGSSPSQLPTPTQTPSPDPSIRNPPASSSTVPVHGTAPPLLDTTASSLSALSHSSQATWSTAIPRTSVLSAAGESCSDGGRSGAGRSDGGRSGAVRSDGGRCGAVRGDGGRNGAVGSDGGRSGAVRSDGGRNGTVGSDGGRNGAVGSDGGRNGAVGSDGGRNGAVRGDGGRSGTVGSDGGRNGTVGSDGGRNGAVGSDGGRNGTVGSDGGRNGAVRSISAVNTPAASQQDQEFVLERRSNPPYRHPPPFVPASARGPPKPVGGNLSRNQGRAPQYRQPSMQDHDIPLQGAPPSQLIITGSSNLSQDPVQLRTTGHRSGLVQRPLSEMIPSNHPQLEFSYLEESTLDCSQVVPTRLLQSAGWSASCTNIEALPGHHVIPPSSQGGPIRTRRVPNHGPSGPSHISPPSSNNPVVVKACAKTSSAAVPKKTSSAHNTTPPASSNTPSAHNSTTLGPSNTSLASTNTPSTHNTTPPASSSTSLVPCVSSVSSSEPHRNTPLAPHTSVLTCSSSCSVPSVVPLVPTGAFSPGSDTPASNNATSTCSATTSAAGSTPLVHSNTSAQSNAHTSSVPTCTSTTHTMPPTSIATPLTTSTEPPLGTQNLSSILPLQLVPRSGPTITSEPDGSGHRQTEALLTRRQQRLHHSRSVLLNPTEQEQSHVIPATSTLCLPSTGEIIQTEADINRGRKSCGHLCLKERRFCCLCQHNGHRDISQEECCLLCTRHLDTGDSTILRTSSLGNCHPGNVCTCEHNELCSVHRLALSQPMTSTEGSRRPASQNCVAM